MQEAIRLFTVSTMDAARSGINQQINLTPDMANEIKVCLVMSSSSLFLSSSSLFLHLASYPDGLNVGTMSSKQKLR